MQDLQNSWRDDTYLLARKRQGTIGMSLCVFLVVWIAVAYVLGVLSSQFVPKSMLSDSLNTLQSQCLLCALSLRQKPDNSL